MTQYRALATDFDGTIAHDGVVDAVTLAALERVRASGRCLLLVTGRELPDLFNTFAHVRVFDRVVAENGALLYTPSSGAMRQLAPAPPVALLDRLLRDAVPVSVGSSIVATVEPHEHTVLSAIRDLGLEWHVVFNKGSVMALPSGVNKASGLVVALEDLGISAAETIAVGDAENDHAFLELCGLKVAVSNALLSLKESADIVTVAARGDGVRELIDDLLAGTLRPRADRPGPRSADARR